MDAVEFLKERERMCKSFMSKGPCYTNDCPMYSLRAKLQAEGPYRVLCSSVLYKLPEQAVAIVEKWSKESPKRTRLTDFLEKYPNAPMTGGEMPVICARNLGLPVETPCLGKCIECWNTPLEEDKP